MATAFVFITTDPASMPKVLAEVKAVDGVEEAEMVYGLYDIIAKVSVETMDKLKIVIAKKIRAINKVLSTQTLLVIRQE